MKKIIFTLCSINYLAQAKTLFESVKKSAPDWHFIVGLVDRNTTGVDLSFLGCPVMEVDKVDIPGFDQMAKNYTLVELLTSVKPFYFNWLLRQFPETETIAYFDPDIMVFRPLTKLEADLERFDVVLTPHFTSPINDHLLPTELHVMRTGIYNLGFLALRRSENAEKLLTWWQDRLKTHCILDLSQGLFVDQLWANLMPAYFDRVLIEKNPGYNMAHWNLHERHLVKEGDGYLANGEPLVFYHFSHYSPANPESIAAYHTRFSFENRPDLRDIYATYRESLLAYGHGQLKSVPCFYMHNEKGKKRRRNLENFLRQALPNRLKGRLKRLLGR